MKKFLTLMLMVQAFSLFSQKIQEEPVIYNDLRLPLKPLGAELKNYNFTVSTPYPENHNASKDFAKKKYEEEMANYPNVVKESEAKYAESLEEYNKDVETARENFKLETEAFEKMSFIERMALKDQKPTLKLPSKPVYYKPAEPRYVEPDLTKTIVFDPKALASTYLRLDGYQKGEVNALKGSVVLLNFEYTDPVQKSKEVSYYDKASGTTQKRMEYYYETQYKRPVEITLEYNGAVVFNGILEGSNEYKTLIDKSYPNLINLEKKTVTDALVEANSFINDQHGRSPMEMKHDVSFVKNKDGEYDDIEKAKNLAVSGYKSFVHGTQNTDLEEAISIWLKELKESDLEDRKARIDEKVTRMLLINTIEAALCISDFTNAENCIKQYEALKNSNSEKTLISKLRDRYAEKLKRHNANK